VVKHVISLGLQRLSLTSCSDTAARVVTDTRKFDPDLKQLIHSELHWLDASEHIKCSVCFCVVVWMELLHGTLQPSLCDCLKTSSSCQSSVCCAVLPLEFIKMSGFLYRRPDDMELSTETSA